MTPNPASQLTLDDLPRQLRERMAALRSDHSAIVRSRAHIDRALGDGQAYYGINTGFGALARKRIAPEQLQTLQRNLLLSHAVGLGTPIPIEITRTMLQLKLHSLALGYSGISPAVFEHLLAWDEHGLVPVVPHKGSLGASGDLAPLAHMCLPLLKRGKFWQPEGPTAAASVLDRLGLQPPELGAKDGLALCNGTQMMTAYGAHVLMRAQNLVKLADVIATTSLEALRGSLSPFDARIHAVRPHPGQVATAANVRALMQGSEIVESHRDCDRVQDAYCLRCVPQVHGASRDAINHASRVIEIEINAATDNPLVFDDGDILSGGNFHGQPLALVLDYTTMALAELGNISERRTYLLLGGHDGLPTLLMKDTGINSGFMIPQYTAAALVSHNKVLSHPACTDSIPTSLGQEDHVSMGSISAIKALEVLENVEHVLAIEAFTASQALDFRAPLLPGRGVAAAHRAIRAVIAHHEADTLFEDDIACCTELLRSGSLLQRVEDEVGPLLA